MLARDWRVTLEESFETDSSIISYGRRSTLPVALKVLKRPGDEWRSGNAVNAFEGRGVVRVYNYVDGALLLERLDPGHSLVGLSLSGHDEEATEILGDVISSMSPCESVIECPTAQQWAKSFERYSTSPDDQIPRHLVSKARRVYVELCRSQTHPRLLHGDLHHYNVLFDRERGWLAIDPKGVVGEVEFEIGAALRNPRARPELFADSSTVEKRVGRFASKLSIDSERVLGWAFAQAVLSAIWEIEDGFPVDANNASLRLARAIGPMLADF
ncbi:MAG: aminoglycoside phosphotransferase family protein [Gemmatimonadota bacterium]|nr:aminoglycoside phosphotransferase family protein [Gemmatimonadota bacterium]